MLGAKGAMTELYVAASGWRAQDLESLIPPACRRGIDRAPAPVIDGENAVVDLPEWSLGPAVRHLLPSFSALGDEEYSFRFEMSVRRVGATWSAWVGAASLGPAPFEPISSAAAGLTSDVDVFVAADPVDAVRLRLRLRTRDPARLLGAPWFLALSACDPASREAGSSPVAAGGVRLPVPVESQMERPESIRLRICATGSTLTRAAASSMASGMPSSRPQICATVQALWSVRAKVGWIAAARSRKSRTDS